MDGGNDGLNTVIPLDQMSHSPMLDLMLFCQKIRLVSLGSNDLGFTLL